MVRARIESLNVRRSSYLPDRLIRYKYWPNRKPYLIKHLREVGASILALQECTVTQIHDITSALGSNWTYFGGDQKGNVLVAWDGLKYDAIQSIEIPLPSDSDQRYMAAVRLQSRPPKPLGTLWVASIHLTQGHTEAKSEWRHKQIRAAIRTIQSQQGSKHSVIAGDLNSTSTRTSLGGTRRIAAELGYKDLRTRLQVERRDYRSFNGWTYTPHDFDWIDDILTPADVRPYIGSLEFCCKRRYTMCATDHNGIRASVEWPAAEVT